MQRFEVDRLDSGSRHRAAELDASFAEAAREDEDFASLRGDPRFPR